MKKMFSLEELLSNCFFPLFCSNLTTKIDKKQVRFQEINRNFGSLESSQTFSGICLNIPQNLTEHLPESLITFSGIFWNISQNLFDYFTEC